MKIALIHKSKRKKFSNAMHVVFASHIYAKCLRQQWHSHPPLLRSQQPQSMSIAQFIGPSMFIYIRVCLLLCCPLRKLWESRSSCKYNVAQTNLWVQCTAEQTKQSLFDFKSRRRVWAEHDGIPKANDECDEWRLMNEYNSNSDIEKKCGDWDDCGFPIVDRDCDDICADLKFLI